MDADVKGKEKIVDSSGNVFTDLGLPASQEDMIKVAIAQAITCILRKRGLTQSEAAHIVNADQAKISALFRGRLRGFSVERLFRYLVLLGQDVDIHISKKYRRDRPGRIKVIAA